MNFYRLRFINTVFLFLIGILIGVYIGHKKNINISFLKIGDSDYKSVYYNKNNQEKSLKDEINGYSPVYYGKKEYDENPVVNDNVIEKTVSFSSADSDTNIRIKPEGLETVEKMKQSNPMDDDDYKIVQDESGNPKDGEVIGEEKTDVTDYYLNEIYDFIRSPEDFKNSKVKGKLLLISGTKSDVVKLKFMYTADNTSYYIELEDTDKIIENYDIFKIGYYYYVEFFCSEGRTDRGNKLISIKKLSEKAPWATGLNIF